MENTIQPEMRRLNKFLSDVINTDTVLVEIHYDEAPYEEQYLISKKDFQAVMEESESEDIMPALMAKRMDDQLQDLQVEIPYTSSRPLWTVNRTVHGDWWCEEAGVQEEYDFEMLLSLHKKTKRDYNANFSNRNCIRMAQSSSIIRNVRALRMQDKEDAK